MVADLHRPHVAADCLHDSGGLLAQHGGNRDREAAVGHVQAGVANAGGRCPDEHFLRARLVDDELLDDQRLS